MEAVMGCFDFVRVAALSSLMIVLVGCGGGGGGDGGQVLRTDDQAAPRRPADTSFNALSGTDDEPISPVARQLEQQSQRDVEAILRGRLAETNTESDGIDPIATPPILPMPAAPETTPSRAIVWTDRHAMESAHAGTDAAAQPSNDSTPPTPQPNQPVAIDPSPAPSAITELASPGVSVNATSPETAAALQPDRLKQLMVDLSRDLHANAAYSETPLKELLVISAMSMVDPERKLNPDAMPDLTEKEREVLTKMQTFFTDLSASLTDAAGAPNGVAVAANTLHDSLIQKPELQLSTTALCTRVGGFGDFTPFSKNSFLAHSEQKTIVYLEIGDFTSQPNDKGEYVTELSQQLIVYSDRDGIPVWTEDWQSAVDVTKNQRQDFFTVQVITLPKALSVGKYTLKIRVRDEKSGAETEGSIPFEMVADPKLAAAMK